MEVVIERAISPSDSLPRFFPDASEPPSTILTAAALQASPENIFDPKNVCVVRGALLADGKRKGWGSYRVFQEGDGKDDSKGKKLYNISRNDAGDFVANLLIASESENAGKWWGYQPVIAY